MLTVKQFFTYKKSKTYVRVRLHPDDIVRVRVLDYKSVLVWMFIIFSILSYNVVLCLNMGL